MTPLGKTGIEVSKLGFGASPLGEEFGPIDAEAGARAVHEAIDRGVNFFDTSPFYGRTLSETRLGAALDGRRDSAVVATKCGRYGQADFDFSAERITRSIDESLARLQTDYVDVLHLHDVEFGDREQIIGESLPALARIKESGKARAIGVTGLQLDLLADLVETFPVDVVLTYARYNLAIQDIDERLTPLCRERGVGVINASPLLLGALTDGGPPNWHPGDPELLSAARRASALCRERGSNLAVLALRYALDHPTVASTFVGIRTPHELEQNLEALELETDQELLADVQAILRPHGTAWTSGRPENHDVALAGSL